MEWNNEPFLDDYTTEISDTEKDNEEHLNVEMQYLEHYEMYYRHMERMENDDNYENYH